MHLVLPTALWVALAAPDASLVEPYAFHEWVRGRLHDASIGAPMNIANVTGRLAYFDDSAPAHRWRWEWSGAGARCDELFPRIRKAAEDEFGPASAEHEGKTLQRRMLNAAWALERSRLTVRCEEAPAGVDAGSQDETELEVMMAPIPSFLEHDFGDESSPPVRKPARHDTDAGVKRRSRLER